MSSGDILAGFPEGVFRTNWLEIWAHTTSSAPQYGSAKNPCVDFEMNALECLEAYGSTRGRALCQKYIHDFEECQWGQKQNQRVVAMRKERIRQIANGERKLKDFDSHDKPNADAYQRQPFIPH